MSEIALILAGHGSHISPNTAGIVWRCVDRLRRWGAAAEITACFWKEAPSFCYALDAIRARQVAVVPVFTAQGYFTQTVIPTEMGLDSPVTHKSGKIIYLTPGIGEHPLLGEIVRQRVQDTLISQRLPLNETAVAVIGHGTRRNRQSREAARRQARLIGRQIAVREVVDAYLDDEPDIPSIYQSTRAKNIIALPYFLANGSHVTRDVPRALGLTQNSFPESVEGRNVFYTEPVGSVETLCAVILELARDTGLPFEIGEGGLWSGFPKVGRDSLLAALEHDKILRLGQVMVTRNKAWHADDGGGALSSPATLRAFAREDPFRPLPTSSDLPGGWHVELEHPAQAHAVIETIYPGLVADWAAQKQGTFAAESLADTAARQSGMFKDIHKLPSDVIEKAVEKVCGRCIRQPIWWDADSEPLHPHPKSLPQNEGGTLTAQKKPMAEEISCKSACNIWLSTARQMGARAI